MKSVFYRMYFKATVQQQQHRRQRRNRVTTQVKTKTAASRQCWTEKRKRPHRAQLYRLQKRAHFKTRSTTTLNAPKRRCRSSRRSSGTLWSESTREMTTQTQTQTRINQRVAKSRWVVTVRGMSYGWLINHPICPSKIVVRLCITNSPQTRITAAFSSSITRQWKTPLPLFSCSCFSVSWFSSSLRLTISLSLVLSNDRSIIVWNGMAMLFYPVIYDRNDLFEIVFVIYLF